MQMLWHDVAFENVTALCNLTDCLVFKMVTMTVLGINKLVIES